MSNASRDETAPEHELEGRLARVRLLALDVDGVLTDGRLYIDDDGRTLQRQRDRNEMLEVFGFFLMVLIGLELLETIKAYLEEDLYTWFLAQSK